MSRALTAIGALGLGALAMYYLDPKQGSNRRAQVRDKASEVGANLQDMAHEAAKGVSDRSRSLADDARSLWDDARSHLPSASGKMERARSLMERSVSTPGRKAATAATGLGAGLLGMASHSVMRRYPLLMVAVGILGYVAAKSRPDVVEDIQDTASDWAEKGRDMAKPALDSMSQRAGSLLQ